MYTLHTVQTRSHTDGNVEYLSVDALESEYTSDDPNLIDEKYEAIVAHVHKVLLKRGYFLTTHEEFISKACASELYVYTSSKSSYEITYTYVVTYAATPSHS